MKEQKVLLVKKDNQMNHIMISSIMQSQCEQQQQFNQSKPSQCINQLNEGQQQQQQQCQNHKQIQNKIHQHLQSIENNNQTHREGNAQKCIAVLMKKVRQGVLVKDFEPSFRFALAIILGIFFLFIKAAYSFRQWTQDQQPIIETIELNFAFFGIFMIGLLTLTKSIIKQIFYQWIMRNLNSNYKGIQRHHRANKIILWIFETIYYFHMTIFGLLAFNNTSWMPVELAGSGSCSNLFNSFPGLESDDLNIRKQMIYFNLIQLAFHTSALLELFLGARKLDEQKKYETGLNHFMFFAIIIYSMLFNLLNICTVFFILHNIGDIIVSGGRAYADLEQKQKKVVYLLIIFGVSIWIVTRFFIVPKCIIFQFIGIVNQAQSFWNIFKYAYIFLLILFTCVIFIEIYWTLFLVQVSVSYLLNPTYKNIYDNRDFKKLYLYIKHRNTHQPQI